MSDIYTKDIANILNSFLTSVDEELKVSDAVRHQLRQMVIHKKMRDSREINRILKILREEADEL